MSKKVKVYYLIDNGQKPFMVRLSPNSVELYGLTIPKSNTYDKLVCKQNIKSYMLGKCIFKTCDHPPNELGNTILVNLATTGTSTHYLFIGNMMAYEFDIGEVITEFGSPIGNSDVPYAYARTATKTIIFLEDAIIDNSILEKYSFNPKDKDNWDSRDPYYFYYGKFEFDLAKQQKIYKSNGKVSHKIKKIKSY